MTNDENEWQEQEKERDVVTLRRLQPEARLALAVLHDAAEILRTTHGMTSSRARILSAEAWRWVRSDDASHPFTFRAICQHLEIDADWLRSGLARWRPDAHGPAVVRDLPRALRRRGAA